MKKGEESRQRLIECAAELFWKNGYSATGISEILKQTDLPKGSFYFYFKSKDDIYLAVVESELDILSDMMKRVADKDISPDKKIIEMIYTRLDAVKEVVYRNGTLRANFFRDIWYFLRECCRKEKTRGCSVLTMWI